MEAFLPCIQMELVMAGASATLPCHEEMNPKEQRSSHEEGRGSQLHPGLMRMLLKESLVGVCFFGTTSLLPDSRLNQAYCSTNRSPTQLQWDRERSVNQPHRTVGTGLCSMAGFWWELGEHVASIDHQRGCL